MSKFKGIVVDTDDTFEEREFTDLKDMQGAVNGLVEHIVVDDNVHLYVNEEALLVDMPVNLTVEWWLNQRLYGDTIGYKFWLRGPVVIFGGIDDSGRETDVKPEIMAELEQSRPDLLRHPDSVGK